MLILQNLTYVHPNKDLLFEDINLSINNQNKIALIGNYGAGKSTLLKIVAGVLTPSKGRVSSDSVPYYVPQHVRQLLNMLDSVCELSRKGITNYGGNYDFYSEQKQIESNALNQDLRSRELLNQICY